MTRHEIDRLRSRVRGFLASERAGGGYEPLVDSWTRGYSPEFSRKLGEQGWLGMTWPREYGGGGRSALDRFVVIEELLRAGAPVAAHWIAERQTGPQVLRFGTEQQRSQLLPRIARGELFISAGLSEPDSGSDLASVTTTATRVPGGWRITGRKVWTSNAYRNQLLLALVRSAPREENRHAGLSQMFIDLRQPGVTVRPIAAMGGEEHFTEVTLDDVAVDDDMVLGAPGDGWMQVTSELAYERSGPERYLSCFLLLESLLGQDRISQAALPAVGSVIARMWALRAMSIQVQESIDRGRPDNVAATVVKDLGTGLEQEIVEVFRQAATPDSPADEALLRQAYCAAPTFTLRGGATEILRNIIAKSVRNHG